MPETASKSRRPLYVTCVLIVALVISVVLGARGTSHPAAQFVGRSSCIECHKPQAALYKDSDHDRAMDHAAPDTVLGDFNNATFTAFGVTTTFFKRDNQFFVNTEGPDGQLHDYPIKYTFGVKPLQQYLVEFPGGRIQCLPIAWDVNLKKWYHLHPDEHIAPHDPLFWTQRLQNWNYMCASCHSTDLHKNYDAKTDTYHTKWSELDVSCEACHGPGSNHVDWAYGNIAKRWLIGSSRGIENPIKSLSSLPQINTCMPCHSRRQILDDNYVHGEPYDDHYELETLEPGLYHADGQILDEVYVTGSFMQSKMYHRNVRCTDCHDPHSLKLITPDHQPTNNLCVRCHEGHPAEKYDTPAHFHHAPGTPGSRCVDCHMPGKNYMVVDFRRDHSIRLPRPDLTVKIGVPNACDNCHADKGAKWAADKVVEWFGPKRAVDPHYGEALAAGRDGALDAPAKLARVVGDPTLPVIVRATAIRLLSNYPVPEAAASMISALTDPAAMVRARAAEGLVHVDPKQRLAAVAPLLADRVKLVRVLAARSLASVPPEMFSAEQRKQFDAALAEYAASQDAFAEMPGAHMNLALLYTDMNQLDRAEQEYQTALHLDAGFSQAKMNLAMLYNQQNRKADAEKLLSEVIASPRDLHMTADSWKMVLGEAYYSRGLLIAEEPNRLADAVESLDKAAELLPDRLRVQYNDALALQRLGRVNEAEAAYLRAYKLDQTNVDVVNAMSIFYAQTKQWDKAITFTQYLARLVPEAQEIQQRLLMLRQMQNAGQ
ncbi:MAG: tetratricopeptide repeat protein [Planctomycetes bacterium]|nr:tetratricopeptide repeat protein [Planctomycetota bacterium]